MFDKNKYVCYNKKKEVRKMYAVAENKVCTKKYVRNSNTIKKAYYDKNRNILKVSKAIQLAELVNNTKPFELNPQIDMKKDDNYYAAFSQSGIELR